jgi:TetR/AcrR family transcriptional regulator
MRTVPPAMADKLMSAAKLFAAQGVDGTKIDEIADITGIPKATLYYYFDGKEQILSLIFIRVLDEVREAVARALARPGTAAERLTGLIRDHLKVFAQYPDASQALNFDLGRAARLPEIAAQSTTAFVDPVAGLLAEGAADGSLRTVAQPRLTAIAMLGAISTSAIHVIALDPLLILDDLAAVITPLLLDGLIAREQT